MKNTSCIFFPLIILIIIFYNDTVYSDDMKKHLDEFNSAFFLGKNSYKELKKSDLKDFFNVAIQTNFEDDKYNNRMFKWDSNIRMGTIGGRNLGDSEEIVDIAINSIFGLIQRYVPTSQAIDDANFIIFFSANIYKDHEEGKLDRFLEFVLSSDRIPHMRERIREYEINKKNCFSLSSIDTKEEEYLRSVLFINISKNNIETANCVSREIFRSLGFPGNSINPHSILNEKYKYPFLRKIDIYYLSLLYYKNFTSGVKKDELYEVINNLVE